VATAQTTADNALANAATAQTTADGAVSDAAAAQATADDKINTFYQDDVPTALASGDLWIDSNDGNKLYRAATEGANEITFGEWELVRDAEIHDNTKHSDIDQSLLKSNTPGFAGLRLIEDGSTHAINLKTRDGASLTGDSTIDFRTYNTDRSIILKGDLDISTGTFKKSGDYALTLTATDTTNATLPAGTKTLASTGDISAHADDTTDVHGVETDASICKIRAGTYQGEADLDGNRQITVGFLCKYVVIYNVDNNWQWSLFTTENSLFHNSSAHSQIDGVKLHPNNGFIVGWSFVPPPAGPYYNENEANLPNRTYNYVAFG